MPRHLAPYFLAKYLELPPIPHPTSTMFFGPCNGSSAQVILYIYKDRRKTVSITRIDCRTKKSLTRQGLFNISESSRSYQLISCVTDDHCGNKPEKQVEGKGQLSLLRLGVGWIRFRSITIAPQTKQKQNNNNNNNNKKEELNIKHLEASLCYFFSTVSFFFFGKSRKTYPHLEIRSPSLVRLHSKPYTDDLISN